MTEPDPIASIDLERDVVKERLAGERFWKLWNGQHCGKRAVSPRSMPGATTLTTDEPAFTQFVIPSEVEGSLELRLGRHEW